MQEQAIQLKMIFPSDVVQLGLFDKVHCTVDMSKKYDWSNVKVILAGEVIFETIPISYNLAKNQSPIRRFEGEIKISGESFEEFKKQLEGSPELIDSNNIDSLFVTEEFLEKMREHLKLKKINRDGRKSRK